MLSNLTWCLRSWRTHKIPRFSVQQSLLRTGCLVAFFGDGNSDVVAVGVKLQHDLNGGNLMFGAKENGVFAARKGLGFGGVGCPLSEGFEIKMGQTVLNQDFHEAIYPN